ncbi:hypothetical protein BC833DRAFT_640047 [Globomyces pollinis-pini]|nr:hypothetical protein BC833DRAFT_640047 [Globomyces pollinis-pini]
MPESELLQWYFKISVTQNNDTIRINQHQYNNRFTYTPLRTNVQELVIDDKSLPNSTFPYRTMNFVVQHRPIENSIMSLQSAMLQRAEAKFGQRMAMPLEILAQLQILMIVGENFRMTQHLKDEYQVKYPGAKIAQISGKYDMFDINYDSFKKYRILEPGLDVLNILEAKLKNVIREQCCALMFFTLH